MYMEGVTGMRGSRSRVVLRALGRPFGCLIAVGWEKKGGEHSECQADFGLPPMDEWFSHTQSFVQIRSCLKVL